MNRRHVFVLAAIFALAALAPLAAADDGSEGAPATGPLITGISRGSTDSSVAFAITTSTKICYPNVEWHIFLPEAAHVTSVGLVDDDLAAGLHIFRTQYVAGEVVSVTWNVAGSETEFQLTVISVSQSFDFLKKPTITILSAEYDAELLRSFGVGVAVVLMAVIIALYLAREAAQNGDEAA